MARKINYVEPLDYFPKEIRKAAKIGEYAEKPKTKKTVKKTSKKK